MEDHSTTDQQPPEGDGVDVTARVIEDLKKRSELGRKKYGTVLKTNNGRDALVDAYQEILDAAVYLKQELEERNNR